MVAIRTMSVHPAKPRRTHNGIVIEPFSIRQLAGGDIDANLVESRFSPMEKTDSRCTGPCGPICGSRMGIGARRPTSLHRRSGADIGHSCSYLSRARLIANLIRNSIGHKGQYVAATEIASYCVAIEPAEQCSRRFPPGALSSLVDSASPQERGRRSRS